MATISHLPEADKAPTLARRAERYRRRSILQHVGQKIARTSGWQNHPFRRCASCGIVNVEDTISIKVRQTDDGTTAYPVGVSTCGSVWSCAVCSAKIRTRRALEVQCLALAHENAGGSLAMMTLTVRHGPEHSLAELLNAETRAWRSLQQSAAWRELKATGLIGQVRSWEITHGFLSGPNGSWHPHFHVLLLWDDDRDRTADVQWVERAWAQRIENELGARPNEHGFDYRPLETGAAEYVAKIANEMTRADLKGSASIWQLVDGLEDGEAWYYHRVLEYVTATKGKRAIQWSRGLRDRYDLGPELTDEEIVNLIVEGTTVDEMNPQTWRRMCRYERGKAPPVVAYLESIEERHRPPGPPVSAASTALAGAGST